MYGQQPVIGKVRVYLREGVEEVAMPTAPEVPFIIGRGRAAHLRVQNLPHYGYISNQHCHIIIRNGYYQIADGAPGGKPSSLGTFVNGQRIDTRYHPLRPNDEIVIGGQGNILRIQFLLVPVQPSPSAPQFGAVDERPTRQKNVPARPQSPNNPPAQPPAQTEVDRYGMPIMHSYASGKMPGMLPGVSIVAKMRLILHQSTDRALADWLLVAAMGAAFSALTLLIPREYIRSATMDTFTEVQFTFGVFNALLLTVAWYGISCGLSAIFPDLSPKTFLPLIGAVAAIGFGSLFLVTQGSAGDLKVVFGGFAFDTDSSWVIWLIRAIYAGAITFFLSSFNRLTAPQDAPRLKPEFAAATFAGLYIMDFVLSQIILDEIIYHGGRSYGEMTNRLIAVGIAAAYGAGISVFLLAMLRASSKPKPGQLW